jgi:hypothetical protein
MSDVPKREVVMAAASRAPESFLRVIRLLPLAYGLYLGCSLALAGLTKLFDFHWVNAGCCDCRVDWGAARLFLVHKSPYTEEGLATMGIGFYGFGHPPTTSFWFLPFAKLEYPVMSELLAIITLGTLFAQVVICTNELDLPIKPAVVAMAFGWLVGTSWMTEHFHVVQVSEIISFTYVLAWYFLRRDRDIAAGVVLGLACTFKLFPGVLVLFLLLSGRIKAVVAACASYLPVAALMTLGYGVRSWSMFSEQQAPMVQYWVGDLRNSSLTGVIAHLVRPLDRYPMMRAIWPEQNIRQLPHTTPPVVLWGTAASLLLLAVLWWLSRRAAKHRTTIDVPFAAFAAASVFVNVWAWEHYYAMLIFPLFVVLAAVWQHGRDLWTRLVETPSLMASRKSLIGHLLGWIGLALVVPVVVHMLSVGMWEKLVIYNRYWALKNAQQNVPAPLHDELRRLDAFNWLPWAITIFALTLLLAFDGCLRAKRGGRAEESADAPIGPRPLPLVSRP